MVQQIKKSEIILESVRSRWQDFAYTQVFEEAMQKSAMESRIRSSNKKEAEKEKENPIWKQ